MTAAQRWAGLDEAWQKAFRRAWTALRTGNIAVGAVATTLAGDIVHAARNRVKDITGPQGEVFGSTLAHAEINVLARLPFSRRREFILTTTLEPCLQCAAAIRLGPITTVRFGGADRCWDGCHEFGKLSAREANRVPPTRLGPLPSELGTFAALIPLLGQHYGPAHEQPLRAMGAGPVLDLAHELDRHGQVARLAAVEVDEGLARLWPRLQELTAPGRPD